MRAALIDSSGKIQNIIELPDDYDPTQENAYIPPDGLKIQEDREGKAAVGGSYINGTWTAPPPATPAETLPSVQDQLDSLIAKLVSKNVLTASEVSDFKKPK